VKRGVALLVYRIDLSHLLDQQVDYLQVRPHYRQMEGTTKYLSPSRIDIRVGLYE
jgi:hypothetical protein